MTTRAVIDLAPWAAGLSSTLVEVGLFAAGAESSLLTTAGLVVGSMTLGMMLNHLPGRESPWADTRC